MLHFSLIDLSKAGPVFFSNEEKYLGKTVCTYMQEICGNDAASGCVLPSTLLVFIQSSLS